MATTFALGAESNRLPACLFVCMFVTLFKSILLLCFSMESSHFLVISSPWQTLQNVVLRILICCHGNEIWAIFSKISNCFFLFVFRWNRAIFWQLVLRDPLYKTLFLDFWFSPPNPQNWLPKIWTKIAYNSASMADRPEMFAPTRGFTMLWGRPLLLWQHFGKFGLFFDKIAHESSCMPDRPDTFGPTSGDDQRGRPFLPRQQYLRQARSLIAYRLVCLFVCLFVCL